ncbi:MAG: tRNA nucleotidyltransferase, partial [Oscillospiraceae bacterium]|nr:tRNA nucleotidyltransferase [Oscillospiraceae bacterium]
WLAKLGEEGFFDLLAVKRADNLAQDLSYRDKRSALDELALLAKEVLAEGQCFTLKSLAVNGYDLMELGFESGVRMGDVLDSLLEKVVEGEYPNDKEVLLRLAKEML